MDYIIFRMGFRVALALVAPDHIDLFLKWMNDPEVTKHLGRHLPMMQLAEKKFLETMHEKIETNLMFLVLIKSEEGAWEPIGTMGLHDISAFHGTATTGAAIGESKYQGKGYGSEAKLLLLRYAFDWLNLRIIVSKVYGSNERSIGYSTRCGYKVVGCIKEYRWHAGSYQDEVTMAITRERFEVVWAFYQEHKRAPNKEEFATPFPK